ncbi:MAG: DNA methyltransferase [Cytophagales bacterium]|nr:DNA methyltransferase [Cytophagales bacterium]
MSSNIPTRSIFCRDNLDVLEGINSSCIDLIYLDPPFNKNKTFTAPIGSHAEGASFKDIFRKEDLKGEWLKTIEEDEPKLHSFLESVQTMGGRNSHDFCYLAYMGIRLLECHRILKDTGSIYLHCDPTMSHYLKLLMDCIFEENNFRNEIVWNKGFRGTPRKTRYQQEHEIVFYYGKGKNVIWNQQTVSYKNKKMSRYNKRDEEGNKYALVKRKRTDGTIYYGRTYPKGKRIGDVIHIPTLASTSRERTHYPTQKPLALLERIIKTSSNEGDLILDLFCGCATTCVAAEKLERKWIGIDVSITAYNLVKRRLAKEVEGKENGQAGMLFWEEKIKYQQKLPKRTDQGVDYREKKYIYVISHPKYPGEYKVGIAKDLKKNFSGYQRTDPERAYEYEYSRLSPRFREVEKHIHEVFPNKHEWVQAPLEEIIAEIKGVDKARI